MFQADNARTGYNPYESTINASTASNLQLQRTYQTGGNITTQPAVVGGQVFWGSWDGKEYSTDLNGNTLWSTTISTRVPDCTPPYVFGVGSSPMIANETINGASTEIVYVGGRDLTLNVSALYALNAATGGVIWETPLSTDTGSFSWSSPTLYNGSIYVGLSSGDDCPLVRGAVLRLDAVSGTLLNTFYTVPDGCTGGSVWSSPAIDESTGVVYISIGNSSFGGPCPKQEVYGQAIIALNASDLSFISSWQVPPSQRINDSDFGATPTLFQATINGVTHQMIGVENKNGIYYALDRSNLSGGPLWIAHISSVGHNIAPSAWDGTWLYVGGHATTIDGVSCKGSLRALDPASGNFIWQVCFKDGAVDAAVSAVPGVVFAGEGTHLYVINSATGQVLLNHQTSGLVQGAASISNGIVYVGSGSGTLNVFGLPNSITPTPSPGVSIGQDTFQRPNQMYWGQASDGQYWGGSANNNAVYSIVNNTGQLASNGTNNYAALLGPAASNLDVTFTASISIFNNSNVGATLRWQDANDFYKAAIDGSHLFITRRVNGTNKNIASVRFTATAGTSYNIRFDASGSTLFAKAWPAGQQEPQNWLAMATDTTYSSGFCGLEFYLQNGVTASVSAFQASTL